MSECCECKNYGWNGDDHGHCYIWNHEVEGTEESCDEFKPEVEVGE